VAPRDVDSRLFGSWPLLALAALAMATLGLAPLGLWLLAPIEYLGKPTPITYNTAAPLHVLALLGGGLSDEPLFGRPYPPYLAAGAVVLGGL
jgi:hypothetical protein